MIERTIAGFNIVLEAVILKSIYFFKEKKSNMQIPTALIKMPKKYPIIPSLGIRNITQNSRILTPIMEFLKVILVFPNPLRILVKVVVVYIKGQSHANIDIKEPAVLLLKTIIPISLPKKENVNKLIIPINKE